MLHDLYQELPTAAAAPAPAQFQSGPAGRPAHYMPLHTRYACVCMCAGHDSHVCVCECGSINFCRRVEHGAWQLLAMQSDHRSHSPSLALSLSLSFCRHRCSAVVNALPFPSQLVNGFALGYLRERELRIVLFSLSPCDSLLSMSLDLVLFFLGSH